MNIETRLTSDDLGIHLQEQLHFIRASAEAYDRGSEIEAKRIALAIRILVHDTKNSISLLSQLNKKHEILYLDSTLDGNLMSAHALVGLRMTNKPGLKSGYSPRLDRYKSQYKKTSFDQWWDQKICMDNQGNKFSRKDLILTMANKDGGAHVDSQISSAYMNLKYNNAMGWILVNGDQQKPLEDMLPASVRQIGYEILETLKFV